VLEPGDAGYEEERKVYNAMIDSQAEADRQVHRRRRCDGRRANGENQRLRVSIRGGGHNAAGLGVCDDGLVIDLAPIK
jgi:hypothetical protein